MDVGSTEIIFNPEKISFNLIITCSKCEVFPPSQGEENCVFSQFIGKLVWFFLKK